MDQQQAGAVELVERVERDCVPPSLAPGTVAVISAGPGDLSAPVVMSRLWIRCTKVTPSANFDSASTYIVPVLASITGVLVMPICGTRSVQKLSSGVETVLSPGVAPCAVSIRLTCHKGAEFPPLSASKA